MLQTLLTWFSERFYRFAHRIVHSLQKRRALRVEGTPQAARWITLSQKLAKPGALPMISVIGPRWNCHAQIASVGPFSLEQSLVCQTEELSAFADSWSIVVYDEQSKTVAWAGSANTHASEVSWQLSPGRYSLIMRVYAQPDEMVVPDVVVDGRSLQCGRTIVGEKSAYERYLLTIKDRKDLAYRLLHYYAFYHLKHGTRSRQKVRQNFIPVGNPDTDWHYGHMEAGERLQIRSGTAEQGHVSSYISFYNWASFPVHWCAINDLKWLSPSFDQPVAYAIRRVRTARVPEQVELEPFEVRLLADCERGARTGHSCVAKAVQSAAPERA